MTKYQTPDYRPMRWKETGTYRDDWFKKTVFNVGSVCAPFRYTRNSVIPVNGSLAISGALSQLAAQGAHRGKPDVPVLAGESFTAPIYRAVFQVTDTEDGWATVVPVK